MVPDAMPVALGLNDMLDTVAAVTVTVVLPTILPLVADRLLVPMATPCTKPALVTDATVGVPLAHVTWAVMSWVLPSL